MIAYLLALVAAQDPTCSAGDCAADHDELSLLQGLRQPQIKQHVEQAVPIELVAKEAAWQKKVTSQKRAQELQSFVTDDVGQQLTLEQCDKVMTILGRLRDIFGNDHDIDQDVKSFNNLCE